MFKRKGGGVKGPLNNVQKNCTFLTRWLPLPGSQLQDLLTWEVDEAPEDKFVEKEIQK